MSFAYQPFYTGDYYRDTRHLSMLQHGAYRQLLDHCWDQRGPLPLDVEKCYRICGAVSKEEQDAVRTIIAEFFVQMDDGHYNGRMQREIERCNAISSTRSALGKLGAQARAKQLPSKSQARAKQMHLSPSPSPSPSQTQETPPKPPASPSASLSRFPQGFETLWSEYPRKVGKDAAAKAFAKRRPDADLLGAMVAAVKSQRGSTQWTRDGGQFVPHLSTWLNEGRWMDEESQDATRGDDVFAGAK